MEVSNKFYGFSSNDVNSEGNYLKLLDYRLKNESTITSISIQMIKYLEGGGSKNDPHHLKMQKAKLHLDYLSTVIDVKIKKIEHSSL